jgi:hypothetical protein
MPSTFSPNLRIELISNGEQAGTWGSTTNTNLGTLIEDAISGYETVSVTTANQALTYADGAADQARNAIIELTTTTSAAFAVYAPPSPKTYVIYNASAHTATIYNSTVVGNTTAAGAGAAIPAGNTLAVWTDGTDFATQNTGAPVTRVSFVGSDTPPTILGSTNVASVVRNATGNFTINFTTALPDANYSASVATSSQIKELSSNLAGSITILNENQSFAAVNPTLVNVAIFL